VGAPGGCEWCHTSEGDEGAVGAYCDLCALELGEEPGDRPPSVLCHDCAAGERQEHTAEVERLRARLALAGRLIEAADGILDRWGDLDGSARETLASAVERYDDMRPGWGRSHGIANAGGET